MYKKLPADLHMKLYTQLRLAHSFGRAADRLKCVQARVVKMAYPGYAKILKKWDFQRNFDIFNQILRFSTKFWDLQRNFEIFNEIFEIFNQILRFLTKFWDFQPNFEIFNEILRFSTKFWDFQPNFEILNEILRFSTKFWDFQPNFEIFNQILRFSTKFWDFQPNFEICNQLWDFQSNFQKRSKILTFLMKNSEKFIFVLFQFWDFQQKIFSNFQYFFLNFDFEIFKKFSKFPCLFSMLRFRINFHFFFNFLNFPGFSAILQRWLKFVSTPFPFWFLSVRRKVQWAQFCILDLSKKSSIYYNYPIMSKQNWSKLKAELNIEISRDLIENYIFLGKMSTFNGY